MPKSRHRQRKPGGGSRRAVGKCYFCAEPAKIPFPIPTAAQRHGAICAACFSLMGAITRDALAYAKQAGEDSDLVCHAALIAAIKLGTGVHEFDGTSDPVQRLGWRIRNALHANPLVIADLASRGGGSDG